MYGKTSETYEQVEKVMTFAGGTTNDPGDSGGTSATTTLFTVTGTVFMKLFAVCTTNLAGALATVAVGTTLSAGSLIAQATATDIDAGDIWHDATPDASVEAATVATEKIVNQDIKQVVATADVTSGVVKYVCLYRPITANATVVAA